MPRTRHNGEGGVYYDDSRNLWIGQVTLEDEDGRFIKRVTAKKKPDMLAKLRALQLAGSEGRPARGSGYTVETWMNKWLNDYLPLEGVADGTKTNYCNISNHYIVPTIITTSDRKKIKLGSITLTKLQPEHVIELMAQLQKKGLSPRTVNLARAVLRRGLNVAIQLRHARENVAAMVPAKKRTDTKLDDTMTLPEAQAVLETAQGDKWEALAHLVLSVGLRQDEALSLHWNNLDLNAGTVRIDKSKTKAGEGTIGIPPGVVAQLRRRYHADRVRRLAEPSWNHERLVFCSDAGTKIDRRNALRWWHDLTIRAGVGRRRFHASRHTAATLMLNNGVPMEVVSKTLRHTSTRTTEIYAKVRPEMQRQATVAMEELFYRPTTQPDDGAAGEGAG